MIPPLSSDLLSRLSGWATAEFGLRFPPDRWSELARGVASAALELGIPDLTGWAERLVTTQPASEHLRAVANHLTISETYFFRQRDAFELMEKQIFPERLARRAQQNRPFRVWSAGCASGEEPYSVAMLIRQRFPHVHSKAVVIVGTDINSHVLSRAARGIYSEWSFRDTPDWAKKNYFTRSARSRFELAGEIRHMVRFERVNLAAAFYPAEFSEAGDFDVILCRNVLMYFSAEWQDRIIRRLVRALAPEGWLLAGPCDVTSAQVADLALRSSRPGVFQKMAGDLAPRAIRPLVFPPLALQPPAPLAVSEPAFVPMVETPPAAVPLAVVPASAPELTTSATNSEVASTRARLHANRGELDAALAACDEAIALEKANPEYHYLRACILQEQNRLAEAAESYHRVLYLEPHSVMAQFSLGIVAERGGREAEARHHFARVLRLLERANPVEPIPGSDGLTAGRLRAVIQNMLADDAA